MESSGGGFMSDIFSRQRGLVDQEKVENLKVAFLDEGAMPLAYKESMIQIAQQLGLSLARHMKSHGLMNQLMQKRFQMHHRFLWHTVEMVYS